VGWLVAFGLPDLPPHEAADVRPWIGLASPLVHWLPGAGLLGLAAPLAVFWRLLGRWGLPQLVGWVAAHAALLLLLRRAAPRTLALSALSMAFCLVATGSSTLGLEALILAACAWRGGGALLYAVLLFSGVLLSELGLWALPLAVLPLAPRWWIPGLLALPAAVWAASDLVAL